MTCDEFLLAFTRLFTVERVMLVRVRFHVGDMWNALHQPRFRGALRAFLGVLAARMTTPAMKRYLKRLRQCGWVAHKWDAEDRDDRHSWTWYVENPKVGGAEASEEMPYFLAVRHVSAEDGEWYECAGGGDKRIMVRVPSELTLKLE